MSGQTKLSVLLREPRGRDSDYGFDQIPIQERFPLRASAATMPSESRGGEERSQWLRQSYRMIRCLKPLFASSAFVLVAAVADVYACSDTEANRRFVEAAELVRKAERDETDAAEKLGKLNDALNKLEKIVTKLSCSRLAVRLVSGQSVGRISISYLERRIRFLRKEMPKRCSSKMVDALSKAMAKGGVGDAAIAAIARKLVRYADFGFARGVADMIRDDDKRHSLQQRIGMAQVRAAVRKEKCRSC